MNRPHLAFYLCAWDVFIIVFWIPGASFIDMEYNFIPDVDKKSCAQ